MFGKKKYDASHNVDKRSSTSGLLRTFSPEGRAWLDKRKELSSELKKNSSSALKGELLGEIVFGRPDNMYSRVIEPLKGKDVYELGMTSSGKPRSLEGQKQMIGYLRDAATLVHPSISNVVPLSKPKLTSDQLLAKSIQGAKDVGDMLRENEIMRAKLLGKK